MKVIQLFCLSLWMTNINHNQIKKNHETDNQSHWEGNQYSR